MIKSQDGTVEFTGVHYERAALLGVPRDVLEKVQMEILTNDLSNLLEGMASKLGSTAVIQIVQDAVAMSLDPRNTVHKEGTDDNDT